MKNIVIHLKRRDQFISLEGLEESLKVITKQNRQFNAKEAASSLYKAYLRQSEQLDSYAPEESQEPYSSHTYLPSNAYLMAAKQEIESQLSAGKEIIIIPPLIHCDQHFKEALTLYCLSYKLSYQDQDNLTLPSEGLEERLKAFEAHLNNTGQGNLQLDAHFNLHQKSIL